MRRNQIEGYKNLRVWQEARKLVLDVYSLTSDFPSDELFGLTSQLRRAAVSVVANITEGYERQHLKEYIQFLYNSNGSLAEVEVFLGLSRDLNYCLEGKFKEIYDQQRKVAAMLNSMINKLLKKLNSEAQNPERRARNAER